MCRKVFSFHFLKTQLTPLLIPRREKGVIILAAHTHTSKHTSLGLMYITAEHNEFL